jgi:hypothetical protein
MLPRSLQKKHLILSVILSAKIIYDSTIKYYDPANFNSFCFSYSFTLKTDHKINYYESFNYYSSFHAPV